MSYEIDCQQDSLAFLIGVDADDYSFDTSSSLGRTVAAPEQRDIDDRDRRAGEHRERDVRVDVGDAAELPDPSTMSTIGFGSKTACQTKATQTAGRRPRRNGPATG